MGRVISDDSHLLGCDGASLGEQFVIFKRIVIASSHVGQVDSPNNAALRSRRQVLDHTTVKTSRLGGLFFFATAYGVALGFSHPCIQ